MFLLPNAVPSYILSSLFPLSAQRVTVQLFLDPGPYHGFLLRSFISMGKAGACLAPTLDAKSAYP